jgi:hypothetical protein
MVGHLQVTAQSAVAYVSVAVLPQHCGLRLGLVKVFDAAMRLTAAGLPVGEMAAGACDGLPLEAVEELLGIYEYMPVHTGTYQYVPVYQNIPLGLDSIAQQPCVYTSGA